MRSAFSEEAYQGSVFWNDAFPQREKADLQGCARIVKGTRMRVTSSLSVLLRIPQESMC